MLSVHVAPRLASADVTAPAVALEDVDAAVWFVARSTLPCTTGVLVCCLPASQRAVHGDTTLRVSDEARATSCARPAHKQPACLPLLHEYRRMVRVQPRVRRRVR